MIGIIGSGNVGANTAFFLAEKGVDHVMPYDTKEGLAKGKALDMMEAAPIRGYRTSIQGTDDPDKVLDADLIIITAGAVRQPGMTREALFQQNKKIVAAYARKITRPGTLVLIVSEPVDLLTTVFARASSLAPGQIMGLGGALDATRLRFLIANELKVSMENVAAQVVGRHGDDMIFLKSSCCVAGVSLDDFLDQDKIRALFDQTRNAGHLIVELAGRASAYYGPSAVAAELAEAMVRDTGRLFSVSQLLDGQFGVDGVALSLPAILGKKGIRKVLTPELTPEEADIFKTSASSIGQTLEENTNE